MFDPPNRVPFSKIPISVNDSAAHRKVALEAARKSIVLLKNEDQTLPLKSSVRKIAVVGPAADDPIALLGNYNGVSSKQVPPLEGIERRYSGQAEVRYALGATYSAQSNALIPAGVLTPPGKSGHGLLAEYFDNPDFSGLPVLRRVEPRIFQQAGIVDPAVAAVIPVPPKPPAQPAGQSGRGRGSGPPAPTASVRWTGTLQPPVTGDYIVAPRGGFGPTALRVFLDDKELAAPAPIPAPGQGGGRSNAASVPIRVQLEAGHTYGLRVEYRTSGPGGNAQLMWLPPAQPLLAEAVEAVKNSDVAVAFVGLSPSLEGEEMEVNLPGFRGGDRTDLNLPEQQKQLVESVIGTGKPVVVVLCGGSAVAATYAAEHAAALLELWYGGEEAGTAIAETLAGANNPAGRLPVTFYKGVEQLPPFEDYSMEGRTYRYFKGEPLYSFGFGLSYSRFGYSGLNAQRTARGVQVSVRVRNESGRDGDEVVQLYVEGTGAPDDAIRSLRGFQRLHLHAGESRTVRFTLGAEDVPKEKVRISVGGGQPGGPLPFIETVF